MKIVLQQQVDSRSINIPESYALCRKCISNFVVERRAPKDLIVCAALEMFPERIFG